MRLGTGAARDAVYGTVNKGTARNAERGTCGATLAHPQHMPVVETYTFCISRTTKKKHKELEYTNSHCSKEGLRK